MNDPEPRFIGRSFVLARNDLVRYVEALIEAFPALQLYKKWKSMETASYQPAPPSLRFLTPTTLPDVDWAGLVLYPSWTPSWRRVRPIIGDGDGDWVLNSPPYLTGEFSVSGMIHQRLGEPPHMGSGEIYIRCRPGNKEHAAIARKVIRLIEKVATNRRQAYVSYPGYEILSQAEKGSSLWIGHDAARWARESPDRMLEYRSVKIGTRPLD